MSTITFTVLADDMPEIAETVIITLSHVSTVGIRDPKRGATIDPKRAKAVLTILPIVSSYGIIGWHTDSLFVEIAEPEGESIVLIVRKKVVFPNLPLLQ